MIQRGFSYCTGSASYISFQAFFLNATEKNYSDDARAFSAAHRRSSCVVKAVALYAQNRYAPGLCAANKKKVFTD